jgi:hypothetical protein
MQKVQAILNILTHGRCAHCGTAVSGVRVWCEACLVRANGLRAPQFSREYSNWPLDGRESLNLTYVESHGRTVEELMENAQVSLETWHGNAGPDWSVEDLPAADQAMLEREFSEFLNKGRGA